MNSTTSTKEVAAKALTEMNSKTGEGGNHTNINNSSKMEIHEDPSGKIRKPRFKRVEHKYPVEPRVIQVIKKPKTHMDHTYRDFSQVPPEAGYMHPDKIEDMTFAQKVHHMLSDESLCNWIHWLPHGRAFKIAVPKRLEQSRTLHNYFGHNRYSSFLRQLNNHGFKHLTKGSDRNCYYHECMLRGLPHLTRYMPPGRDARRLIADPENEPDFYQIDRLFPLQEKTLTASNRMSLPAQAPLSPLLGGLGNFQQIPQGLLNMTSSRPMAPPGLSMDTTGSAAGISNNFGTSPLLGSLGNIVGSPLGNSMGGTLGSMTTQQQIRDPQLLAVLLQQQQQLLQQQQQQLQQSQSQHLAQSSLLRYM